MHGSRTEENAFSTNEELDRGVSAAHGFPPAALFAANTKGIEMKKKPERIKHRLPAEARDRIRQGGAHEVKRNKQDRRERKREIVREIRRSDNNARETGNDFPPPIFLFFIARKGTRRNTSQSTAPFNSPNRGYQQ